VCVNGEHKSVSAQVRASSVAFMHVFTVSGCWFSALKSLSLVKLNVTG